MPHFRQVHPTLYDTIRRIYVYCMVFGSCQDQLFHTFKLSTRGSIRKPPNCVTWVLGITLHLSLLKFKCYKEELTGVGLACLGGSISSVVPGACSPRASETARCKLRRHQHDQGLEQPSFEGLAACRPQGPGRAPLAGVHSAGAACHLLGFEITRSFSGALGNSLVYARQRRRGVAP